MKDNKNYYDSLQINPINFENIDDKRIIHQFENQTIYLNFDKRNDKKRTTIRYPIS